MQNQGLTRRFLSTYSVKLSLLTAVLVLGVLGPELVAQQPFDPLTPAEIAQAKSLLLNDGRVKQNLGNNSRFRILSVERREQPKDAKFATQRGASVTLYIYTKDETMVVAVRLGNNAGVDALVTTRRAQPALSPEELEEAKQLAMANPAVQFQLGKAGLSGRSEDLIVTYLFAKSVNEQDACATHRCVILFFNTPNAVLDVTPVVDLSAQRVQVR